MRVYGLVKLFSFFLSAALLISMVGCVSAGVSSGTTGINAGNQGINSATQTTPPATAAPTEPANSFDYVKYRITKEEVDAQHAKYGKLNTELEISEFNYGEVLIKLYPFAMNYDYTAADFQEIGCTSVKVLGTYPNADMPTAWIKLSITDQTKQGVKDAIATLIQRPDVYCVTPNYITKLNPDVTAVRELTEEAKQAVSAAWLAVNKETLDWDAKNNLGERAVLYFGSYNGKYVIATMADCPNVAVEYTYDIGPYTMRHNCPFDILVCVNGGFVSVNDAYEQELLTADETMAIVMYCANIFDFDQ